MSDRWEQVESPGAYVTDSVSLGHFCLSLCSFGPPSHALVLITWRGEGCRYMIRLGQTAKRAQLLKIKALVPSICAKGCMLDDCVCVIWLDMITPPWCREKVMIYYYYSSLLIKQFIQERILSIMKISLECGCFAVANSAPRHMISFVQYNFFITFVRYVDDQTGCQIWMNETIVN